MEEDLKSFSDGPECRESGALCHLPAAGNTKKPEQLGAEPNRTKHSSRTQTGTAPKQNRSISSSWFILKLIPGENISRCSSDQLLNGSEPELGLFRTKRVQHQNQRCGSASLRCLTCHFLLQSCGDAHAHCHGYTMFKYRIYISSCSEAAGTHIQSFSFIKNKMEAENAGGASD